MSTMHDHARFNGTVFMTVAEFNKLAAKDRHNAGGTCYAIHNGKWMKVGFRKPVATKAPVKLAA